MSSPSNPAYPTDVAINEDIVRFFETFYKISDTAEAHENYVESFTTDATLVMASKTSTGRDDILAFRKSIWEKVRSRRHTVAKVFPFGSDSDEVMLYGIVEYEYKNGQVGKVPWASRAVLVKNQGSWKMSFYQVYLDTK